MVWVVEVRVSGWIQHTNMVCGAQIGGVQRNWRVSGSSESSSMTVCLSMWPDIYHNMYSFVSVNLTALTYHIIALYFLFLFFISHRFRCTSILFQMNIYRASMLVTVVVPSEKLLTAILKDNKLDYHAYFWLTGGRWHPMYGQVQWLVRGDTRELEIQPVCCTGECRPLAPTSIKLPCW